MCTMAACWKVAMWWNAMVAMYTERVLWYCIHMYIYIYAKLFVQSKRGHIACYIMVLSKTYIVAMCRIWTAESIVYFIDGRSALKHAKKVQIKAGTNLHGRGRQTDRFVKGTVVKVEHHHKNQLWGMTSNNHLWLVFEAPKLDTSQSSHHNWHLWVSGPPTLTTAIWILHGLHALQWSEWFFTTIPLRHR